MSDNAVKEILKRYQGGQGNKTTSSQLQKNQNTINTYKTRLAASGVDPDEAIDKRNWLEKALNLKQDQNVLFDIFELINRPQQALFTGWKNAQEGKDFLEGAKQGLFGNEETQFKDILKNYGMKDREGKLDLADVLGFAGDVFLDPADIVPVAGFKKIGNALDEGAGLYKALKQGDSLTDITFKGLGKGIKGGAKLADTGIEKGLKYLDETKGVLNNAGDVVKLKYLQPEMKSAANLVPQAVDGLQDITGVTGRLQLYKGAKNKISNAFNVSDAAKEAIRTKRSLDTNADTARELSKFKIKEIENKSKKFAEKTSNKYGDATQLINDGRMLINSTVNRTMNESDVIRLAMNGDMPAYPEAIEHLKNALKRDVSDDVIQQIQQKYGKKAFDITVDKGNKLKLGKGWKDIQLSNADELMSELTTKQKRLKKINSMSEKQIEKLDPYDLLELEDEASALEDDIRRLSTQKDAYTVKFNRRYTPEQEEKIRTLAQRYGNNEDGYRDFIDSIFGTAWKRQDSDVVTQVSNKLASDFANQPLSKNQALLMENEPVFTGRTTARDVIDTSDVRPNSDVWFRNEPMSAATYTKKMNNSVDTFTPGGFNNRILGPENIGEAEGGVYAGLLNKSDPNRTLNIDVKGENAFNIPYKNIDAEKTFKTISKETRQKIEKLWDSSVDELDFANKLKNDKKLTSELRKLKIDLTKKDLTNNVNSLLTLDLETASDMVRDSIYSQDYDKLINDLSSIDNIDTSYLINILSQDGKLSDKSISNYFRNNNLLTDDVINSIAKNQSLGRNENIYDTVRLKDVYDANIPYSDFQGDNIGIFNPQTGEQTRSFKALANKTPALETPNVFDVKENAKRITKGGVDTFNDIYDDLLNTNLSKKYNYLTNDNYVAANILTPEGKNIVDEISDLTKKGIGKGNSNLLNTRKYVGAPEETNNFIREFIDKIPDKELENYPALKAFKNNKNAQFMETDYIKALTNRYVDEKGLSNVASSTQLVNQTLLDKTFKDYDEMTNIQRQMENAYRNEGKVSKKLSDKYKKLFDDAPIKPLTDFDKGIPDNFTKVTSQDFEQLINKYTKTNNQFGNAKNSKALTDLLKKVSKNGNDIAINNDILRVIGAASDHKNVSALNTMYNKYLNVFKKWKTASPTNFLNNMFGNSSNLMLGGVSMADQARLAPQVIDVMQNGEKFYLQRLSGAKLSDAANKTADLWSDFRKMGFGNASLDIAELPQEVRDIITKQKKLKGAKDYIINGLPSMFGYLNQKGDVAARLTVMLKAYEDPGFLKKLGAKDAYEAVSKIMFDPEMLTSTEKKFKQLIPFYTYTKNNLVYQITNLQNNGKKYNQLMKTMKSLRKSATNGNEDDMAEYIKNNLYIPLPGLDKDGNYSVLRAQLPFGDLNELINNPIGKVASVTSPLIKGIYEQTSGIDTFTGRPIESFPGQKSSNIDLFGWQPTKRLEKAISDFSGMDVFLKNATRLMSDDPLNMVRMRNNVDTDKLSRSYEQIDDLKNLMKQYEQKGYEFSTMSELKKANKNGTVAGLDALFAKYGIK